MFLTDTEPNFRASEQSYVPGNADESPFVAAMTTALGSAPTLAKLATLPRLFREAYSLAAAELKHQQVHL